MILSLGEAVLADASLTRGNASWLRVMGFSRKEVVLDMPKGMDELVDVLGSRLSLLSKEEASLFLTKIKIGGVLLKLVNSE
ncbi:hypothetical protein SLEP1_g32865 [Rubroshorea leprosula]|uniref:Uncharacterized protein n=1 Tax=Rubroshorea leprosula TaxID=152421 RepID=A0AAV5KER2_9ROSI|nr:hypothetical protein SLEP1_g32865 [Rubroshorea leprosula]